MKKLDNPDKNGPFSFIMRMKNLSNLHRANQMLRLKEQNVAEHSFYVTLIAMWICDEVNLEREVKLDRALVMEKALLHDVCESYIGDLSSKVKRDFPLVGHAFRDAEHSIVKGELFEGLSESLQARYQAAILENTDSEESEIVYVADLLDLLIQAFVEIKLGNKFFQEIWVNASSILNERAKYPCVVELLRIMNWEIVS